MAHASRAMGRTRHAESYWATTRAVRSPPVAGRISLEVLPVWFSLPRPGESAAENEDEKQAGNGRGGDPRHAAFDRSNLGFSVATFAHHARQAQESGVCAQS